MNKTKLYSISCYSIVSNEDDKSVIDNVVWCYATDYDNAFSIAQVVVGDIFDYTILVKSHER